MSTPHQPRATLPSQHRLMPSAWRPELRRSIGIILALPALTVLGVMFIWPVGDLIAASFAGGSFTAYHDFFNSHADVRALMRTALMAGVVATAGVMIGSFLAWEMRTTRSQVKRLVLIGAVLFPLWTGLIVRNYALSVVFQRHGLVNDVLLGLGIRDEPARILYTESAVFLGMLYVMLPYAVLPLYATFLNIDLDLAHAARTLGASATGAFRTVILPLAAPMALATWSLIFVISLGFYVTPLLLGGAESPFIASRISSKIFTRFDLPGAAAAGVVLLLVACVVLGLGWKAIGGERIRRTVA